MFFEKTKNYHFILDDFVYFNIVSITYQKSGYDGIGVGVFDDIKSYDKCVDAYMTR
jgi:hypothetical protein